VTLAKIFRKRKLKKFQVIANQRILTFIFQQEAELNRRRFTFCDFNFHHVVITDVHVFLDRVPITDHDRSDRLGLS
jgi:hypothetical protein